MDIVRQFGLGVSMIALISGAPALARDEVVTSLASAGGEAGEARDGGSDAIVVTGSRVARDGGAAPTPVTILDAQALQMTSPVTIADALNQLPVFSGSTTPTTAGTSSFTGGQNLLNLRNLGTNRNLILLDGRRFVSTIASGGVDTNLMPSALVSRVDVVTGGASAAYGSDAVSGVVNFILDTKFTGVKVNGQTGISSRGDAFNYGGGAALGLPFAQGRGHFIASVDFAKQEGILATSEPTGERAWYDAGWRIITNPSAPPRNIAVSDVRNTTQTFGGIISSGPLRGIEFDAAGTPVAFDYGLYPSLNSLTSGGSGPLLGIRTGLMAPVNRVAAFARLQYELTDDILAYAEFSYGRTQSRYRNSLPVNGASTAFTIQRDNAFLPESVRDQMTALNITTFRLGKYNRTLGWIEPENINTTKRGVVGLQGEIAGGWKWDAYYTHGSTLYDLYSHNNIDLANYVMAIDAVRRSDGVIVCRSTLTDPGNGCVPLNIFGEIQPSEAARRYVQGTMHAPTHLKQDVAEASVRGDLAMLPAGPLSVAAGVGYRRESINLDNDPVSNKPNPFTGLTGAWLITNHQSLNGSLDLWEVFGEAVVPIVSDAPLLRSLEANLAARYTSYSESGGEVTWKAGVSWQPFDDLRFRLTRSRDVRAPNVSELFTKRAGSIATIRDPQNGNIQYNIFPSTTGNPDLEPERADTLTFGAVYRPSWAPGLVASVDYYDINIKGAIGSLTAQVQIDQCQQGVAEICALIGRGPDNLITSMLLPRLNLSSLKQWGIDFELGYRFDLAGGRASLRGFANYLGKLETITPGATPIDRAGDVGINGTPHWRALINAEYETGPWTLSLQESYVGSGKYDTTFVASDLADNSVPARWYTNVTVRRAIDLGGSEAELFATVLNLFDTDPPLIGGNASIHETIGRRYTIGFRAKF